MLSQLDSLSSRDKWNLISDKIIQIVCPNIYGPDCICEFFKMMGRYTHINELHWGLFIGSCLCVGCEILKTAQRKSQNPNESNGIDSGKTPTNALVPLDPQMHIFLVTCTNYDNAK